MKKFLIGIKLKRETLKIREKRTLLLIIHHEIILIFNFTAPLSQMKINKCSICMHCSRNDSLKSKYFYKKVAINEMEPYFLNILTRFKAQIMPLGHKN